MSAIDFKFKKLNFNYKDVDAMIESSDNLKSELGKRRTVRTFKDKPIPIEIINNCLLAASSSPSGANKQPYKFVVINNPEMKEKIKVAAEEEEWLFYNKRASKEWIDDLKPFKTDHKKDYLTVAPYLIAVFAKPFDIINEKKVKYYYPIESTGLATGSLISTLHLSGLGTLTHTPSPLNFLNKVLDQPKHYKAMLLLIVGYPDEETVVPVQGRKKINEIAEFI